MLLSTECRAKGRRVSQIWLIKVTVRQRSQIYRTSIPLNAGYIWLHMLTYGYIWLQYIIFLLDPKGWGPVISWFQTPSKYSYSNLLVSNPISFPTRGANYSGPHRSLPQASVCCSATGSILAERVFKERPGRDRPSRRAAALWPPTWRFCKQGPTW